MLVPAPRAMPVFYPVLPALNQKQPGEMGKGNHDVFLSTCMPAGCAVWCCMVILLQQQYRAAEHGVFPPPPRVAFLLPSDPCAGV